MYNVKFINHIHNTPYNNDSYYSGMSFSYTWARYIPEYVAYCHYLYPNSTNYMYLCQQHVTMHVSIELSCACPPIASHTNSNPQLYCTLSALHSWARYRRYQRPPYLWLEVDTESLSRCERGGREKGRLTMTFCVLWTVTYTHTTSHTRHITHTHTQISIQVNIAILVDEYSKSKFKII